jgi:pSer/pThr/pTyr-binding forkhead associated (FHA) protein
MVQRLVMRRGPAPGTIYDLTDPEVLIGRGGRCQIVIRDDEISREHCKLVRHETGYELIDTASTNGTFVNGQRVTQRPLKSGELIELGDSVTLRYERLGTSELAAGKKFKTPTEPIKPAVASVSAFGHYLVLSRGSEVGAVHLLNNPIITVGRDAKNDIVVAEDAVSRYHLTLKREKTGYVIEDVGSTNGTFLNAKKLEGRAALNPDDVLRVGTVQLHYVRKPLPEQGQDDIQTRNLSLTKEQTGELVSAIAETLRRSTRPLTHRLGTGLEPGRLVNHTFLLYTRPDWEKLAAPLMVKMQDAGLQVWVDQYLVQGTDDWVKAVDQAAKECTVMALMLSRQATSNPYVKLVYRKFVMTGKPIIPMLVDGYTSSAISAAFEEPLACDSAKPDESFTKLIGRVQLAREKPVL